MFQLTSLSNRKDANESGDAAFRTIHRKKRWTVADANANDTTSAKTIAQNNGRFVPAEFLCQLEAISAGAIPVDLIDSITGNRVERLRQVTGDERERVSVYRTLNLRNTREFFLYIRAASKPCSVDIQEGE